MSLINRMLKDLEAQPVKGDVAPIYRPPSRRLPSWYWWILLLLPLSLWLWWQPLQQWLHPVRQPVVATAPPQMVAVPSQPIAPKEAAVVAPTPPTSAEPVPDQAKLVAAKAAAQNSVTSSVVAATQTASVAAAPASTTKPIQPMKAVTPVPDIPNDPQEAIADERDQAEPMDDANATAEPEPLGEMYVEEQKLSAGEIAALERRKYQQAIARRDNVGAQQALLQVLANDPLDLSSRKQLAALYYGENQLNAAREVLQQGISLLPTNADLRLLHARVAQAMGDKQAALQSLQAITPSASNNLDFYAMRAALAQQLGQAAEAGYSYQALTKAQPMVGRWWLGLAISKEQRGLMADAKQAYRRALLDNQLSAASRRFAQQRIQHLEP